MKTFTFVMLSALTCGSVASAQPFQSVPGRSRALPFASVLHNGVDAKAQVGRSGKNFGKLLFGGRQAQAPVSCLSQSKAAEVLPIWVPQTEEVWTRSYKTPDADMQRAERYTLFYDKNGSECGWRLHSFAEGDTLPYSRQMVSYDEQGRQSVVTFEVSKDGKTYSPFWITTYKYDPVVQSFVTEQKTLMWNADSAAYVFGDGGGCKRWNIVRDARGRVLTSEYWYQDYSTPTPQLKQRLTATYADSVGHAVDIKYEGLEYDYNTNEDVWQETESYRSIKWAATDDQYVDIDASFLQGEQRMLAADTYYAGQANGTLSVTYDAKNVEDYAYVIDQPGVGKQEFKIWTTDANGSYEYHNKTTYIANDYQGSGWDLDSVVVKNDDHGYTVSQEKYLLSDVKVANGEGYELQDGNKYHITYHPEYDTPQSVAYEGYYYISTDPDNPWGSFEQRYVETKRTDYSDYINAAEGAGEFTAIKPVGKSAVDIDVRMGANQVSFTAPGLKSYRLFDAKGRVCLLATGRDGGTVNTSSLPKGQYLLQIVTVNGVKCVKIAK